MKKIIILTTLIFSGIGTCYSQEPEIIDISYSMDLGYILASISLEDIVGKRLSNTAVRCFQQHDPKSTPEDAFDGTDEVLVNLLISLTNTGEYSKSELYIIPNLYNPQVLKIEEDMKEQKIIITIEYRNKEGKIFTHKYKFDMLI